MGNSLKKEINYSLPSNTKPIEYSLSILPNLKNEEFEGTVLIDIEVVDHTNHVVLHSRELQIKNATISNVHKKGEPKFNSTWKLDQDNDILIIYTTQNLTKGARFRVRVEFKGRMSYKTAFGFALHTFVNDRMTPTK